MGKKPVISLVQRCRYYYHTEVIGVTRYYTALQANAKVDAIVSVQGWDADIQYDDICILDPAEGNDQYKVAFIQKFLDSDGLKIRRLTLERLGENYVIPT